MDSTFKVESICHINKALNLSNKEIDAIISQVDELLTKAHKYAFFQLNNKAAVSLDSIANLDKLCQTYQNEKICIFTGAGVSFTESKYYQTPGWWDLLSEIYTRIHPEVNNAEIPAKFEQLRKTYSHPWQMASHLEEIAGKEKFIDILRQLFYHRTTKQDLKRRPIGADKDKRLPIDYLNHALTLNAVIAFCSKIRAIRKNPCFVKNEKIQAVLTLNYDCFVEAGATQKYNSGKFKPRISRERLDRDDQLAVYHIHGYIPYGGRKPAKGLVLTEASYQRAYQEQGNASITLNDFLSCFSTLFIGISFNDELLLKHLERIAKGDEAKNHFAFLKIGTSHELLNRLRSVNVFPILLEAYEQIPLILEQVFQTCLSSTLPVEIEAKIENKIRKVGLIELTKNKYWELLLYNKK
jgi:hypothetical protein